MLKGDKKRKTRSGSKSQSTVPAFLLKTYEILENPAYNDIISWNREGNAFIVKRINEFSEKVLPKYFKHNNFASFVRQLNMYDFHKSRHENNENEFRHKLFKRGQKHLLGDIKRKISEGHGFNNNQVVAVNKDFDIDKFKKEANHFTNELGSVKRHQNDLEKVTKMIYNQNSQLLKENKLLWNELIKNKDKYERKIEKLMLFIFSVMQQSGNQLGPSEGRKSLTNAELSETLGELTGDAEQAKKFLSENENGTIPDRKDNEQFFQKMSKYLQNKGNNDTNLNSLFEQIQSGNIDEMFKNQPETGDEEIGMEDRQNLDPNLDMLGVNNQPENRRIRKKSRGRRGGPSLLSESNEDEEFKEAPNKFVKTETEPLYGLQQNLLSAQEPINMMTQEISDEPMRRDLPSFSLGLSRGPSFNTDTSILRAPNLVQQKSSTNDFLFSSPKPFVNPLKEDDLPELYNIDSFNNKSSEPKEVDLIPQGKSDPQLDEAFSPTSFMNNNNPNGFNFGQPFDDTMYRN